MALHDKDFADLEAMNEDIYAFIKERDFTRRLLPHLIPSEDGSTDRAVDIYTAAAGHASRMIKVVDDLNPNKVLFIVPPLVSQTPMSIRTDESPVETSINVLSDQYVEAVTTNHPGYVNDTFVRRLIDLNYTPTDTISMVYTRMWVHIYNRYNLPLERLFGDRADEVREYFSMDSAVTSLANAPTDTKDNRFDELTDDDFEPM